MPSKVTAILIPLTFAVWLVPGASFGAARAGDLSRGGFSSRAACL